MTEETWEETHCGICGVRITKERGPRLCARCWETEASDLQRDDEIADRWADERHERAREREV